MTSRLRALKIDFVSMVPRGANQDANFVLAKSDEHTPTTPPEGAAQAVTGTTTATVATEPTTINKADLDAAITAAVTQVTKSYEDKIAESNAAVATLQKSLEETTTRAQQAELVAKAEQDARESATAVAKAQSDYPHLPGTTPAVAGALVHRVAKTGISAEDLETLNTILKAASEAVAKSSLFDERGSSASTAGTSGENAYEQLEKVAKGLQESDPKLTPAAAISRASELRPDLVQADRKERGFIPANGYRSYR
jgi:hypothetical protein